MVTRDGAPFAVITSTATRKQECHPSTLAVQKPGFDSTEIPFRTSLPGFGRSTVLDNEVIGMPYLRSGSRRIYSQMAWMFGA